MLAVRKDNYSQAAYLLTQLVEAGFIDGKQVDNAHADDFEVDVAGPRIARYYTRPGRLG